MEQGTGLCYSVSMRKEHSIIVTHDGKFHADDVFAVATLLLVFPGATVTRTRDEGLIKGADAAVDVGGIYDEETNRFDHHQKEGAGVRENGIPFAAFGLVWKRFGEALSKDRKVAYHVEETLVSPIDANDNGVDLETPGPVGIGAGVFTYTIVDAIRAFDPTWLEEDHASDAAFAEATLFAKRIIEREIKRGEGKKKGEEKVIELYEHAKDKRLIVLPHAYSWKDTLCKFPLPLFVVHPQNGTWRVCAVRDNPHVFVNRKDLPAEWAGLRDRELSRLTGVEGSVFCHRNRFMAVAESKEGAIALANLALEA